MSWPRRSVVHWRPRRWSSGLMLRDDYTDHNGEFSIEVREGFDHQVALIDPDSDCTTWHVADGTGSDDNSASTYHTDRDILGIEIEIEIEIEISVGLCAGRDGHIKLAGRTAARRLPQVWTSAVLTAHRFLQVNRCNRVGVRDRRARRDPRVGGSECQRHRGFRPGLHGPVRSR